MLTKHQGLPRNRALSQLRWKSFFGDNDARIRSFVRVISLYLLSVKRIEKILLRYAHRSILALFYESHSEPWFRGPIITPSANVHSAYSIKFYIYHFIFHLRTKTYVCIHDQAHISDAIPFTRFMFIYTPLYRPYRFLTIIFALHFLAQSRKSKRL